MSLEYHLKARRDRLEEIVKHVEQNPGITHKELATWIAFSQGVQLKTLREYLDVVKFKLDLRDGCWYPREAAK